MIKAIAFDLWGCLIRENDIKMTPQEEILEKEFGNLNSDEKYFFITGEFIFKPLFQLHQVRSQANLDKTKV